MLYAVGEIALVVSGILIALQINNWNERQKQIRELKAYALSLSSDLKRDVEMIQTNIWQTKSNVMRIDSLANYVKDKSIDQISSLHIGYSRALQDTDSTIDTGLHWMN